MKIFIASLATGIFVTLGSLLTLIFIRALLRDEVTGMIAMYIFFWPVRFVLYFPHLSTMAQVWISLALGILLDIVIVSLLTYFVLRTFASRRKRVSTSMPPQAPTF